MFYVRNQKELLDKWIPMFFQRTKLTSFKRKLYRWGFKQVSVQSQQGNPPSPAGTSSSSGSKNVANKSDGLAYYHNENFQLNDKGLLKNMRSISSQTKLQRERAAAGIDPPTLPHVDRKAFPIERTVSITSSSATGGASPVNSLTSAVLHAPVAQATAPAKDPPGELPPSGTNGNAHRSEIVAGALPETAAEADRQRQATATLDPSFVELLPMLLGRSQLPPSSSSSYPNILLSSSSSLDAKNADDARGQGGEPFCPVAAAATPTSAEDADPSSEQPLLLRMLLAQQQQQQPQVRRSNLGREVPQTHQLLQQQQLLAAATPATMTAIRQQRAGDRDQPPTQQDTTKSACDQQVSREEKSRIVNQVLEQLRRKNLDNPETIEFLMQLLPSLTGGSGGTSYPKPPL